MGFRGRGGYRGDLGEMTGYEEFGGASDESSGLDTSMPPDFSDVTGGSSSTYGPDIQSMGLPDFGAISKYADPVTRAISQFIGSGSASAAAAGIAGATAGSPVARRAAKRVISKLMGTRGMYRTGRDDIAFRSGRRMNPGNFKALRRSMRRLTAFEHAARRVIHFTHPKPTARVKFRFKRRRKR